MRRFRLIEILFVLMMASISVALAEQPGPGFAGSSKTAATSESDDDAYQELNDLFTIYQPYLTNITAYNPMYFIMGTNPSKSKFQISFKYRLFRKENRIAVTYPWLTCLHFGYTQTSFWDLATSSAAFEDTSYKPELFFLSSNMPIHPFNAKAFFIQAGLQHESNGRGEEFSRSTNFAYIKPMLIFYDKSTQFGLQISPRAWLYVMNDDDTNPDLDDYRGYFDLQIKTGKADTFVLDSNLGWANKGLSFQSDLTYPLHRFLSNHFDIYLHIQYANKLGDNLLEYQQRVEAFRVGFGIVR